MSLDSPVGVRRTMPDALGLARAARPYARHNARQQQTRAGPDINGSLDPIDHYGLWDNGDLVSFKAAVFEADCRAAGTLNWPHVSNQSCRFRTAGPPSIIRGMSAASALCAGGVAISVIVSLDMPSVGE
jgi:hypothetical protein